jgi:hypothetical protein
MKLRSRRWWLVAAAVAIAVSAVTATQALGGSDDPPAAPGDLGQLGGLLGRDHLTMTSIIQVDLSKQTVRLPLYKGTADAKTVWFVLLDASDQGLADNNGVNFAPKLANLAIGCPACVQTVTLDAPTPQQNRFGQAIVNFQGAPDFRPTRIAEPGPGGFPLAKFQPGAVAGPGYSPFIRIAGSNVIYSAPIVAVGAAPSTWSTTPIPVTGSWASTWRPPRRPASTWSRGSTCCSSRASTPASRSSTSAPTPASP